MLLPLEIYLAGLALVTVKLANADVSGSPSKYAFNSTSATPLPTVYATGTTPSSNFTCLQPDFMGFTAACSCMSAFAEFQATNAVATTSSNSGLQPPVSTTQTNSDVNNYVVPSDCCRCYPMASRVQVLFWPVETNTTGPSITPAPQPYELTSDGFTYTSPYVYVVYSGLSAEKLCVGAGNYTDPPGTYDATRSYLPNELSTTHCNVNLPTYTAINYTELQYSSSSSCSYGGTYTLPFFSVPTDMIEVNPAWSTCTYFGLYEAYDPPVALHKAGAMVQSQDPTSGSTKSTPAPGAHVTPTGVPATATSAPIPTPVPQQDTDPNNDNNGGASNQRPGSGNSVSSPNSAAVPGNLLQGNNKPSTTAPNSIMIAGQTATKNANGGLVVGSLTIAPDATSTISDHVVANSADGIVAADGTRYQMGVGNGAVSNANAITIAGQTASKDANGGLVIGSVTIPPGATSTISGHTIANDASGTIVLDGTRYAMGTSNGAILASTSQLPSLLTMDGQTFTAESDGVAIDGHTLSAGGSAFTLQDGVVVSLGQDGWLHAGASSTQIASATTTGVGGLVMYGFGGPSGSAGSDSSGSANESGAVVAYTGAASRSKVDARVLWIAMVALAARRVAIIVL